MSTCDIPLIVNTSAFSESDLTTFLECSNEIEKAERNRIRRKKLQRQSSFQKPTREEIFEVSILDEDEFVRTLELNADASNLQNLDLSRSIENLMKYFDEDVSVDEIEIEQKLTNANSKRSKNDSIDESKKRLNENILKKQSTPENVINKTKQSAKQNSASMNTPVSSKTAVSTKPPIPRKSQLSPAIQRSPKQLNTSFKKTSYHDYKENFKTYEESVSLKKCSPKILQLAQMFDEQFNKSPRKSIDNWKKSSVKAAEIAKTIKINKIQSSINKNVSKPIPKERTIFDNTVQQNEIPKPRPRSKNFDNEFVIVTDLLDKSSSPTKKLNASGSTVYEENFSKLSVKDKILLFNQFVEEVTTTTKNYCNKKTVSSPAEKLNQSDLENKPKSEEQQQTTIPKFQSVKKRAAIENIQKIIEDLKTNIKSKKDSNELKENLSMKEEVQSVLNMQNNEVIDESNELKAFNEPEILTSSLTVVLKPSPPRRELNRSLTTKKYASTLPRIANVTIEETPVAATLPRIRRISKVSKSRRRRSIRNLVKIAFHPVSKRHNYEICSYIPFDIYGPPKKIRRTKMERSNLFENRQLESRFYEWLMMGNAFESFGEVKNNKKYISQFNQDQFEQSKDKITNTKSFPTSEKFKFKMFSNKSPLRNTLTWQNDYSIIEKSPVEQQQQQQQQSLDDNLSNMSSLNFFKTALDFEELDKRSSLPFDRDSDFIFHKRPLFHDNNGKMSDVNSYCSSFVEIDPKLLRTCASPARIQRSYTLTVMQSPLTSDTEAITYDTARLSSVSDISTRSCSYLPSTDELESIRDLEWQPFDKSLSIYRNSEVYSKSWQNLTKIDDIEDNSNTTIKADETNIVSNSNQNEKQVTFDQKTKENTESIKVFRKTPKKTQYTVSSYSTPVKNVKENDLNYTYNITNEKTWSDCSSPITRAGNYQLKNRQRSKLIWSTSENNKIIKDLDELIMNNNRSPSQTKPIEVKAILQKPDLSKFWISAKNCQITFNIFNIPIEKLKLLYDDFNVQSSKSNNVSCGIDNIEYTLKKHEKLFFEQQIGISKYWFSAEDYMISFNGEFMTTDKIEKAFRLIKDFNIKFGVDDFEFSKIKEINGNTIATNLNQQQNNRNSACSKTSDLEPSEFETDSDQCDKNPIICNNSNHHKYGIKTTISSSIDDNPRNSISTYDSGDSGEALSSEDNDPLDDLFNWVKTNTAKTEKIFASPLRRIATSGGLKKSVFTTRDLYSSKGIIADLLKQRNSLRKIENKLHADEPEADVENNTGAGNEDECLFSYSEDQRSYQYCGRLHNMVKAIQFIGKAGYTDCTREQLESYIYTLCRHADISLTNCIININNILDELIVKDKLEVEKNKIKI